MGTFWLSKSSCKKGFYSLKVSWLHFRSWAKWLFQNVCWYQERQLEVGDAENIGILRALIYLLFFCIIGYFHSLLFFSKSQICQKQSSKIFKGICLDWTYHVDDILCGIRFRATNKLKSIIGKMKQNICLTQIVLHNM